MWPHNIDNMDRDAYIAQIITSTHDECVRHSQSFECKSRWFFRGHNLTLIAIVALNFTIAIRGIVNEQDIPSAVCSSITVALVALAQTFSFSRRAESFKIIGAQYRKIARTVESFFYEEISIDRIVEKLKHLREHLDHLDLVALRQGLANDTNDVLGNINKRKESQSALVSTSVSVHDSPKSSFDFAKSGGPQKDHACGRPDTTGAGVGDSEV